jgi:predicted phage replisome organizer
MNAVRWIKLSTDLFNDEKIRYIEQLPEADSILTIWVKLLVLAGQKNMGGEVYFNDEIPYTDEMLSAIFHRKVNTVRLALETFQKLRMIELSADKTIIICNWSRHQNVEGLDKIRQQTLERVRKHRLTQPSRRGNVTRNVTDRYGVTPALRNVTPTEENKNKKREDTPTVPKGTDADVLGFDETKQWLNDLFGRKRAWSDEEDALLAKLLPISQSDRALLQWAYSLNRDSEGWALVDRERVSKPKHSLIVLLREFSSEIDKWRSVGKHGEEQESDRAPVPAWNEQRQEAAYALYGEGVNFAHPFHLVAQSVRREIDDRVAELAQAAKENAA